MMKYRDPSLNEGRGAERPVDGNNFGPNGNIRIHPKEDYNSSKIVNVGTSDANINPGWTFDYISLINTGNTTLLFCIDKSTDDTPNTKLIYIPPGGNYNRPLKGAVLHYKSDSAGGNFVYVLEKDVVQ